MIGTGVFTTTGLMAEKGATQRRHPPGMAYRRCDRSVRRTLLWRTRRKSPALRRRILLPQPFAAPCVRFHFRRRFLWSSGLPRPIAASSIALNLYIATVVPNWPVSLMAALHCRRPCSASWTRPAPGQPISDCYHLHESCSDCCFRRRRLCNGTKHAIGPFPGSTKLLLSSPFAVVLVFVAFAYAGWNAAAYIGTELKEPVRTLPRSLLIGTTRGHVSVPSS